MNIQQFNMLQDVITHFSKNPFELRSVNNINEACLYMPPIDKPLSTGCAIGIFISEKLAKELDDVGSINYIFQNKSYKISLPKWMQKMDIKFLQDLQDLHDTNDNWTDINISEIGIKWVEGICNRYDLPFKKLKFKK